MGKSQYIVRTRGGYVAEVYHECGFTTTDSIEKAKGYDSLPEAAEVCEMFNAQAVVEVAEGNRREWRNVYKRSRRKAETEAEE